MAQGLHCVALNYFKFTECTFMGKTLRKNITWRLTWKLSPDFKCVPSYCKPEVSLPHLPKWTTVLFIKIRHLLWKVCSTFQKSWKGWQPFHISIETKRDPYFIDPFIFEKRKKTYSTRVIIPLSVLENTAANGVTPSLSTTSRDDGECSERKQM